MADKNFNPWIINGDEWIVSYLSTHPRLTFGTVERFSIAHAFEQYFKAALVKKHDSDTAMKKGHDVYAMFKDLKADPNFLPSISIEQDVYDSYSVEANNFNTLPSDLQSKILKAQHLILVFKYTADLKYWKFKKAKGQISMGTIFPDNRYAEIFYGIRNYLGWDGQKNCDILKGILEEGLFNREEYSMSKTDFLNICINGNR